MTAKKDETVAQHEEAMKHLKLAAKLVGHSSAKRMIDELATEARLQRAYLMDTGGWS